MNQRILAVYDLHARCAAAKWSEVGIVLPQLATRRSHIGKKSARIAAVQIANSCREHHDIARRLEI